MATGAFRDNAELKGFYDSLHTKSDLRFPLADYPLFYGFLPVTKDSLLLDVACGKGFFLAAGNKTCRGVGVDFSAAALAGAKLRGAKELLKGEAERLPFRNGVFDCLVNLGSLEHFLDKGKAIAEMARVTKPDGRIMIIVPNGYDLKTIWKVFRTGKGNNQDGQEELAFMAHGDWRVLLESNGLAVERTVKYNGFAAIDWHYVRTSPAVVTTAEKCVRWFLGMFLRPLIPLNLSNYFIFLCRPKRSPLHE
jgi:SAM-dependent methyltransferase